MKQVKKSKKLQKIQSQKSKTVRKQALEPFRENIGSCPRGESWARGC